MTTTDAHLLMEYFDTKFAVLTENLDIMIRNNVRGIIREEFDARLAPIENDILVMKGVLTATNKDVQTLKGDVTVLKDDVSTLKDDVRSLKKSFSNLDKRVERLEATWKFSVG